VSAGPPVSVILPVGGVDEYLPGQLDALVAQTYRGPWELVLSLNSADPAQRRALESLLVERPALHGRVVDSSSVRSASHARNVGATDSSGSMLLFCDGDDLADREWIDELVSALATSEAVGGHLDEELLSIPGQETWRPPATPGALPAFLGQPYLVSANMGVRREHFELAGGFDTTLTRGEDIAFSWDLIANGIELTYVASAVIHYRHRRGMIPMMKQHYLYGRGFSEILSRRGVPGSEASSGLRALRPNSQPVDRKGLAYYLRRGSIAAGRVVGLAEERRRRRARQPQ